MSFPPALVLPDFLGWERAANGTFWNPGLGSAANHCLPEHFTSLQGSPNLLFLGLTGHIPFLTYVYKRCLGDFHS